MDVDRARFAVVLIAPDAVQQEVAGEHLAAAEDQHLEELELLEGEGELFAALERLVVRDVDHDVAGAQGLRLALLLGRDAAQEGLDARGKLAHGEGLGDVVVRAELQAEDLVHLVSPCGEHDDRDVAGHAVALEAPADLQAVDAGQHDVQQHKGRALHFAALERLFPGQGRDHVVSGRLQVKRDQFQNMDLIIHSQDGITGHV